MYQDNFDRISEQNKKNLERYKLKTNIIGISFIIFAVAISAGISFGFYYLIR